MADMVTIKPAGQGDEAARRLDEFQPRESAGEGKGRYSVRKPARK
jgi:hypothetical protein